MAAKLIKGAEVAAQIREELKAEVAELKAKHNLVPGLVTILVGQDPAPSATSPPSRRLPTSWGSIPSRTIRSRTSPRPACWP